MSDLEQAFRAAIADDPDDAANWLALADWLAEQGRPWWDEAHARAMGWVNERRARGAWVNGIERKWHTQPDREFCWLTFGPTGGYVTLQRESQYREWRWWYNFVPLATKQFSTHLMRRRRKTEIVWHTQPDPFFEPVLCDFYDRLLRHRAKRKPNLWKE